MFKKVVAMIMAIALVVAGIQFTPATVDAAVNSAGGSSSWKLVWNDEFNQTVGGTPDTSVWSYDTGHGDNGWGNFEVQNYTSSTENVYIADVSSDSGSSDGRALAIKAMRKGSEITSGRIKTIGKQYLKYGKIEAKIRVENSMQSGVWPAFWMLGNNMNSGVSWPWSGEIDIMEHRNAEQQIIGTLHWNTGTGTSAPYNHVYSGSETTRQFGYIDTMESWHKYGIEWYENQIKFFLDDVCYQTLDISSAEMEEFRENYFILLNLAIGSTSTPFTLNQTVSDSFTDATMYVDYVRVYQGTDSDFYIAQNQVQETSAEPTTVGDGMTTCSGEKTSLGGWGYYVLGGNSAKYSGGSSLSEDFVLKVLYNNKATWKVQAFTQNIAVTAGHTYNVSVNINSTAASDAILMKDEIGGTEMVNKALAAGDNTFTGTFTATSDTMQIMFNLAGINSGTTLTFSNVTVTDTAGSGGTEETTTVDSSSVAAPTDVEAYNFYAQEKGYMINFTEVTDAVSYNVYMDHSGILANITGSGAYVDASVFSAYADGELHSLYLQSVDAEGGVSAKSAAAQVRVTSQTNSASDPADINRIYVVTNSGTKGGADITKATKTAASLTIISGESGIKTASNLGTIKRRGNSTSLADKPAYNISFDKKAEVMEGREKGKKWCLLANAYEKTLLRSKLAMDLGLYAGDIASPAQYYADLYIDGIYQGNFIISEPAECGRSGCEYDDGDTSDELLFEWEDNDKNEEECLYYRAPVTDVRFVTEDTLDTGSTRYTKWVDTLSKFENALIKTSSDEVFSYMDVDSFVSMYIINELFQTVDFGYSSVKFYVTYDASGAPTIHAGPLWDFDLSSGNSSFAENRTYNTFRGQNVNIWFRYLMQNETFKNKVIEKYKQLQPRIQNIYKDNYLGTSQITQISTDIEASRIRNYTSKNEGGAGWSESVADGAEYSIYPYSYSTVEPYNTYTYDQHIEYLETWLQKRNEWICSQWGINPADYEKDPEAVDGTLTVVHEWEKFRHQEISWTAIDSAVGYAIYTDGILYKTVESSVLEDKVPAWAFATENRNGNDQPTSVGLHNTAVVAILEGDTAPDNLLDVNEKRIIDRNTFTLNVNYIYGNGTDLWNDTGVYSPWNFTVCEQGVEDEISAPANVAVSYKADGSANLTINSVGVHAQGDQAWTIKAAIYDGEVGTENFINLAFDIKGPAVLAGQEITIKCIAEEVQPDGEYAGNPYEEKNYMFELEEDENGEQYAVIHYSNSFESTNDTYDLLFGLGLLDPKTINDGNPIDLTLSDTTITKVYGITSLTPAPVVNTEEPENSGIFVSWQTDVPNLLASQYSYNVYIDGVLATLPEGESAYKNNLTYYGYAPGEHTVKVESIYNGAITSTKETIVTIEEVDKPDLVVTNIDIDRKTEWHIGETVPIHITVKNIGTAKAEGHGHLAIFPYVAGKQHGHLFVNAGTDKMHTLDVGEEYTATFNYTISAEDDKGGYLFDVTAVVDGDGNYKDVESNPNNNTFTETFKFFVPITEVTLTNEGDHVKMDWEDHDSTNKQYIVTYYVEGETEPRTTQTGANVSELELPKGVWLTEGSQVTVQSVHTDGVTHVFALGNAYSDLIISNVDVSKNTYAVGETVPIKVTMKNVGVTAATSTGNMTLKPIKNGVLCTAADGNIIEPEYRTMAEEGLEQKLAVDGEFTYTFNYTVSETDLTSGVISLGGYADADYGVVELIDNSTEDAGNNITEASINIVDFVQQPMDWTPLYDSKNHDQIYEFEVANSSVKANIEYKVLDTSFTDINYEDLVTKYEGYNNFYMSIGFEDSHKVVQVNHEEGKMSWSYTNTWFQQVRKEYLVDENGNATDNVQVVDNEYLNRLPSQGCDIYGYDDKFFENTSETPLVYNRNGFNFNVNSFAPGKYYIMSLVDYDENKTELNYITLAFRVTQELEGWSRIGANDGTDIDKLAAFYHDSEHQVNAKFYYDNSDLGLACITAYNGTHLTITTDTSKKLNDDVNQTKIEIAYGVYDEVSRKVTAPENWDEVCINPGIYGKEGTNNLQVDIASLMDELPIHSANGGATDRGYYFLKIYNDLENEPESFIPVPLMVQAEIPEIIPVQGLKVSNRGSMLTVSWTSTSAQIEDGFLYDVYLDDVLQEENVLAGSYNLPGSSTIGTVHQVVVKAKWCEQVSEASVTYEMKEPETEPEETIPAGTPSYPQDDQWVLIKGQNVLPISQEGSFGTVNAQIWYYTDEDISSVVGYNDYYIALNGSDKYFTGESGRIFVQNGENTFFASKTIYDNHYSGQMLMNAEQLFTTYGDWQNGDTLYYTVRVVGNNGNTYKDFYFKVIPTEESSDIAATGDWRNISGTCELPVKMGDSSELLGTVSFLDCPVATDTYTTGTNTYDIVGYNGYYMSIIGDSQYYTGPDTKISVSEAKDTVQYAEDAPNLTFTEKTIYDKVYAGQIIIKCADTFTVEYATTYYLLKVESGESVTYIPVEIQVDTGDVEVLGFQMNTNQNAGGVAENSPSFRVVSKASKVMTIDNKLYEVKKMGTIYAAADEVDDDTLRQNMTLDGAEANDYIQYFESTANGKLHGYTTTEPDSAYNTYFALTFKYNDYMFHTLEQNYAVRAYAVLDDGTVVYGHNVYKANMYEIAQNLYESQKMGTKAAHDFLYTNVLNVVDMYNHSSQISNAMFKALNITSYDDPGYSLVESMSYDIFDYARCLEGYTYQGRGEFRCSEVENELLTLLNIAQETQYDSVYQWIYHETSNYGKKDGTKYQGCYRLTEYGWDSSIDKEFYTE